MSSIPAMSSSVDFIPILQVGVSWATWSSRMQGELERTSVWCYASGDITIPSPPCQLTPDATAEFAIQVQLCREYQELKHTYEDALKADYKAKGLIKKYLAANQLLAIASLKTSKEIWDKLKTIHITTSTGIIAFYIKVGILQKQYTEGENLPDHLNFFLIENGKLADKQQFLDKFLAQLMLISLPTEGSTWDPIVAMILQTVTEQSPLTTTFVAECLKMEYLCPYSTGDSTNSTNIACQAAWTKTQQRKKLNGPICLVQQKSNHTNAQCRQQNRESTNDNGDSVSSRKGYSSMGRLEYTVNYYEYTMSAYSRFQEVTQ